MEIEPIVVSIVVPTYNEESVIGPFLAAARESADADWEILIVDDGSADRTAAIVENTSRADARVRVVTHERNRGLGEALRTGFAAARGDVLVTMDADLSHPFDTARQLANACLEGADAAFGSRFVAGGGMVGVPWPRRLVSSIGNLVFRLVYWSPIHDMTTGLRAYRRSTVDSIETIEEGFAIQLEVTVRLLARRTEVQELPLMLTARAAGESKMEYRRLLPRYLRAMMRLLRVRWMPHPGNNDG